MRCAPVRFASVPAALAAPSTAIPVTVPSTRPFGETRSLLVLRWQGTPPVAHWVEVAAPAPASTAAGARATAAPRRWRSTTRRSAHSSAALRLRPHTRIATTKE
jgi:hypothetical protein